MEFAPAWRWLRGLFERCLAEPLLSDESIILPLQEAQPGEAHGGAPLRTADRAVDNAAYKEIVKLGETGQVIE